MRERGWTRLRNFAEVDRLLGTDPGHARDRWEHRKQWWEEHRPTEDLPGKIDMMRTRDGQVLYVNGDMVLWRAYTVDGTLFWTQATYLEGYDTAADFVARYSSLDGHDVRILF